MKLFKDISFWCIVLALVVVMVVHHFLSNGQLIEGNTNDDINEKCGAGSDIPCCWYNMWQSIEGDEDVPPLPNTLENLKTDGTVYPPPEGRQWQWPQTSGTWQECQQRCINTPGCVFFNRFENGNCHITDGSGDRDEQIGIGADGEPSETNKTSHSGRAIALREDIPESQRFGLEQCKCAAAGEEPEEGWPDTGTPVENRALQYGDNRDESDVDCSSTPEASSCDAYGQSVPSTIDLTQATHFRCLVKSEVDEHLREKATNLGMDISGIDTSNFQENIRGAILNHISERDGYSLPANATQIDLDAAIESDRLLREKYDCPAESCSDTELKQKQLERRAEYNLDEEVDEDELDRAIDMRSDILSQYGVVMSDTWEADLAEAMSAQNTTMADRERVKYCGNTTCDATTLAEARETWNSQRRQYNISRDATPTELANAIAASEAAVAAREAAESDLYSFIDVGESFVFDNCGKLGQNGPTRAQCLPRYAGDPRVGMAGYEQDFFNVIGEPNVNGIQVWTVPTTGEWKITAKGAREAWQPTSGAAARGGGLHPAGEGAIVEATFSLIKGDKYMIMVGQFGTTGTGNGNWWAGGGGGGTFFVKGDDYDAVTLSDTLIVAGGGGGSSAANGSVYTDNGGGDGENISSDLTIGGSARRACEPHCYNNGNVNGGGGGGGLISNGGSSDNNGGFSFKNGGRGGGQSNLTGHAYGGFGGGGCGGGNPGGGGGGIFGGDFGSVGNGTNAGYNRGGMGGGSHVDSSGSNVTFSTSNNNSHGSLTVTLMSRSNQGDNQGDNQDDPYVVSSSGRPSSILTQAECQEYGRLPGKTYSGGSVSNAPQGCFMNPNELVYYKSGESNTECSNALRCITSSSQYSDTITLPMSQEPDTPRATGGSVDCSNKTFLGVADTIRHDGHSASWGNSMIDSVSAAGSKIQDYRDRDEAIPCDDYYYYKPHTLSNLTTDQGGGWTNSARESGPAPAGFYTLQHSGRAGSDHCTNWSVRVNHPSKVNYTCSDQDSKELIDPTIPGPTGAILQGLGTAPAPAPAPAAPPGPPPQVGDMIMRSDYNGALVKSVLYEGEPATLTWEKQHELCTNAGLVTPGSSSSSPNCSYPDSTASDKFVVTDDCDWPNQGFTIVSGTLGDGARGHMCAGERNFPCGYQVRMDPQRGGNGGPVRGSYGEVPLNSGDAVFCGDEADSGSLLDSREEYTITTCGVSGMNPPTTSECSSLNIPNKSSVHSYSEGIHTFTFPSDGVYSIEVAGGAGGYPKNSLTRSSDTAHTRGHGAILKGNFTFSQNDQVKLLVGQQGIENPQGNPTNGGAGGGGGSFVWRRTATLLIAAGGGGGRAIHGHTLYGAGENGSLGENGTMGTPVYRNPSGKSPVNLDDSNLSIYKGSPGTGGGNGTAPGGKTAKGWRPTATNINRTTGAWMNGDSQGWGNESGFGGGGCASNHAGGGGGGYSGGGIFNYRGGSNEHLCQTGTEGRCTDTLGGGGGGSYFNTNDGSERVDSSDSSIGYNDDNGYIKIIGPL